MILGRDSAQQAEGPLAFLMHPDVSYQNGRAMARPLSVLVADAQRRQQENVICRRRFPP
jgi:hypothetical protein